MKNRPFALSYIAFVLLLSLLDHMEIVPFRTDALVYRELFQFQIWRLITTFGIVNKLFSLAIFKNCYCIFLVFSQLENIFLKKADFMYMVIIVAFLCLIYSYIILEIIISFNLLNFGMHACLSCAK